MRIRLFLCLVAAGMLAGVTSASAASLTSATWVQGINTAGLVNNVPVALSSSSGSATTASSYTAFVSINPAVNVVSSSVRTGRTPSGMSTGLYIGVVVSIGPGGQQISTGVATPGMPGSAKIKIGGLSQPTGVIAPLAVGVNSFTSFSPLMGIHVSVTGYAWTSGSIKVTGLTASPILYGLVGATAGTLTFHGTNSLTPGGNGSVTLVSPSKVTIVGGAPGTNASYTTLQLNYGNPGASSGFYITGVAAPEPGTLLLLGAGIAGLVAVGRSKKRA